MNKVLVPLSDQWGCRCISIFDLKVYDYKAFQSECHPPLFTVLITKVNEANLHKVSLSMVSGDSCLPKWSGSLYFSKPSIHK